MQATQEPGAKEPRWPALVAVLGIGGLYTALPSSLMVIGPRWLLGATVIALLLPTEISHRTGHHFHEVLGYVLNSVVTLAMIASLALLIAALPAHEITPQELLCSAAALWVTNILVFASWY